MTWNITRKLLNQSDTDVKIMLMGNRTNVLNVIAQLHQLGFLDLLEWSKPAKHPSESDGHHMSLATKRFPAPHSRQHEKPEISKTPPAKRAKTKVTKAKKTATNAKATS